MNFILSYLLWSPDPDIFTIPLSFLGLEDRPVRWYGLLFAGGFILSQQVLFRIFRKEGRPEKDVEKLTVYMVVAVVVGARLGHCLFYNPGYYLSNPIEIIKVWEGGLASHGGALGMFLGLYMFCKKYPLYKLRWIVDRMVIVVALTGAMIRIGNFFNSEMEGTETHSNMGVVYAAFTESLLQYDERVKSVQIESDDSRELEEPGRVPVKAVLTYASIVSPQEKLFIENNLKSALNRYSDVREHIDFGEGPLKYTIVDKGGRSVVEIYGSGIVRHAAQLYEAGYCVVLMLLLYWLWWKKRQTLPAGFSFGLFMFLLWSLRFVDEFFKMNQEAFEANLALNMGQLLSIPMALFGVWLMVYVSRKRGWPRMAE
ncbi:prolipoprotein diacylglyceryl transferase [Marinoscillum sp. MHG1-6]|uniref:prolipoprotein diacylglyceryl transferase n=1 Tax=Marinoscillum sp. MHG1-6 TaxID=2959627 RepID=UPI002157B693|nr:prolipoprotein diacylglyceryl transferase [Marinoscillum sp. MHG1-6]